MNRDSVLFLYNNHFCLKWKPEGVSFEDAIKELKDNFNIVDKYITEENVTSHFKYELIPKKTDSHLSDFIVYDFQTHNTDRARPYVFCFYRLSKLAGRYNRDLTPEELEKCEKDTIAFDGDNCVATVFDFCLKSKGDARKVKKIVEYNLQIHAHNGSSFDTWIKLNNLPCDNHIVGDIFKNGKVIVE